MNLTIQEQGEELMILCENLRPTLEDVNSVIIDLDQLNMYDYWRDLQLFAMSCLSVMLYGDTEPPEQLVETRYIKQNEDPEQYSLVSTDHQFDGEWYEYFYKVSNPFGKPTDDGEIFYNTLDDDSVDKFQIAYIWSGTAFDRDSIFLGNIVEPSDTGKMIYVFNKNKTVTKKQLDYVFQTDRFIPFYKTIENFIPPIDNGATTCSNKKTIIKRYEFNTETELWEDRDYVLGYITGSCGYTGYTAVGTAMSEDWIIDSYENTFSLYNDVLTQALLNDGLIPPTSIGQRIVVSVTENGTFTVSGSFNLGFGESIRLTSNKNILYFSSAQETDGTVSIDRNGSFKDRAIVYTGYDHTVDGTLYRIHSIELDGSNGYLKLRVDTQNPHIDTGQIVVSIA